jgi:hypothetical protein
MDAKKTKKAVLVYEPGYMQQNIGDYVQSLAALQYFDNKSDLYLNREYLNQYQGEPAELIMNGWFTHQPENWPPSKDIIPLFVSFHINSLSKTRLLSPEGVEYLKQHEPIGCRDKKTVELLTEKGVKAYFSGCLTLTLGKTYKSTKKSGKVYFVDPHFEKPKNPIVLAKALLRLATDPQKMRDLSLKLRKNTSFKSLIVTSSFYNTYSAVFDDNVLLDAEYIQHYYPESQFKNENEKFELAKSLLRKYAQASLVVTSRIHCALPSLGMETPVLYVNDAMQSESSYCRLDGIVDLFTVLDYKEHELSARFNIPGGKIDYSTPITNKSDYKVLKDKLIQQCEQFVVQNRDQALS